jgi:hypothetical protein
MTLVPGLGGFQALAGTVVAVGVALSVALLTWRARGERRGGAVAALAIGAITFFAVTRFPDALHTRRLQWRNQRTYSGTRALAEVERENGAPAVLFDLARKKIPEHATFAVVAGPSLHSSAPQSFAQFELMPRLEEYNRPCRADWVVFIAHEPVLSGAFLDRIDRRAEDSSVAHVKRKCAK